MNLNYRSKMNPRANPLNLKPIGSGASVVLTEESRKRLAARKKQAQNFKNKGLRQEQVQKFLKARLARLFDQAMIEGALTQNMISTYLSAFSSTAIPILRDISPINQDAVIKSFTTDTKKLIDHMSVKNGLSKADALKCKVKISINTRRLYNQPPQKRKEIVEDIGIDLLTISKKLAARQDAPDHSMLMEEEIISTSFGTYNQMISLRVFLKFPLNDSIEAPEESTFEFHRRYLDLLLERKKISQKHYKMIIELIPAKQEKNYLKYFNIFPGGQFDESVFTALLNLWQNNGLDRLEKT